MREIVPGIFHWTARHPAIGMDVSSYFVESSGVLLDPMVPAEGIEWFRGDHQPKLIVLTIRHHYRQCAAFVEDFGIEVWCHENGLHEFKGGPPVRGFAAGQTLAPGLTALEMNAISPDDTALRIEAGGGALAFGDGLIGLNAGRVGLVPDGLLADDPEEVERVKRLTRGAVERLLEQDFEHLLFAHGHPVVGDGRRRLEHFLGRNG